MSVLANNLTNGLDSGLVVLRDVVAFGRPAIRGHSFSRRVQPAFSKGASLAVVCRNSSELIKY